MGIDANETPITLAEACEAYGGRFKISTLRAEASRGRLEIFRIGRRDYTTIAAMRMMVCKCQDAARLRACTSTPVVDNGPSETARALSAQAALSQTVEALKRGLPNISGKSTRRAGAARH